MGCINITSDTPKRCIEVYTDVPNRCIEITTEDGNITDIPVPEVEFISNGCGSDGLDSQGTFHPHEGGKCELRVLTHEEIISKGIKYNYYVSPEKQELSSDGTITWREPIDNGMYYAREIRFTYWVEDKDGKVKGYTERKYLIFPEKPIAAYLNTDGSYGVKCNASSLFDLFSDDNNVEEIWILRAPNGSANFLCENCHYLKKIHFLCDTSGITSLKEAFYRCYRLESFPMIDTSNVTNFDEAWYYCASLKSFPAIDTGNGRSFYSTWMNCTSLKSFPAIDTSNATSLKCAWKNCRSLESFPMIDTSNVIGLEDTWMNCSSLKSFPCIDASNAQYMEYTWKNCSSLTSFPHIKTKSGAYLFHTWSYCCSLPTEPFEINSHKRFLFDDGTPVPSYSGKHYLENENVYQCF